MYVSMIEAMNESGVFQSLYHNHESGMLILPFLHGIKIVSDCCLVWAGQEDKFQVHFTKLQVFYQV